MNKQNLESVARGLVRRGKGILAADESLPTIKKRFDAVNVESTEETRRAYRSMLFETPGLEEFISGVIMFDETITQETESGMLFVESMLSRGITPGIKVDKGAKELAGFPGEKITEGLDALRDRLAEYFDLGARFTKWRAVITIGRGIPTTQCIDANAHALARFAALSQDANLVPVVEPEVLMTGDHNIETCEEATAAAWQAVFSQLNKQRVFLEGMLLKPNMVLSGKDCPEQADVAEAADRTVRLLRRHVPAAVPGIVFLSGGQSAVRATKHLNAMNSMGTQPWELSFSFARALQQPALDAWKGEKKYRTAAQRKLLHRARCNNAARFGRYSEVMEKSEAEIGAGIR